MSTIVRYSSGSTYTLVPNKVDIEKVQDLDGQYHIPYSSIVGMMRLGLGIQKITVSGDILDMSACLWHDVVAISFDSGTSYQAVYFASVPYTSDCWSGIYPYALSLLASPLKEQTAVRYPTTGYKWGLQSITGISQAGNVNAFPTIHYLAPLFYAPLSNTLVDFAGQSVTFTRTASKTHKGVTYPINTPIFDNGLYLGGDTAQDVALWTPPASVVRTIAMQIKQTRPITGTNLIANGDFEANVTGWAALDSTVARITDTPLVGAGSLRMWVTGANARASITLAGLTAGHVYQISALVKTTAAAGRKAVFRVDGVANGTAVDCSATPNTVSLTWTSPAGSQSPYITMDLIVGNEYLIMDTVRCYDLTALFGGNNLSIWQQAQNRLIIDIANNLLKWTDDTTTVQTTFPTADYFAGKGVNIIVTDDTGHAVLVTVHSVDSNWYGATGTLAAISWVPYLFLGYLGSLQGSITNLIEYPYVLTAAEYQPLIDTLGSFSSLSLLYNSLYIGNRYAGEVIKGSDKRLVNANGSDISALLGGVDIAIGASAVTITQTQGLSARWYVEVKRTDV